MHAPEKTNRRPGRRTPRSLRHHQGVALIEVLVAMLIFMLGVVGLIGLQASMTRAQSDSKFRADAAYLANEATGRMWADLTNLSSYNSTSCASVARCQEWLDKVANGLPGGTGTITIDVPTGDVSIVVSWTLPSGETHRYQTATTITKAGG